MRTNCCKWTVVAAVAASIAAWTAADAAAKDFNSTKGFSFAYPDGWVVAVADGKAANTAGAEMTKVKLPQGDWSQVSVMVLNPNTNLFAPNVNVVITSGQVLGTESNRKRVLTEMPPQMAKAGTTASNINAEVTTVAGRQAISVTYDARQTIQPVPVHIRQVFVPAAGDTLIITCTAAQRDWAGAEANFSQIIASLKAPPAMSGWDIATKVGIVVGAIAGGIVGLVLTILQKKKRRAGAGQVLSGSAPVGGPLGRGTAVVGLGAAVPPFPSPVAPPAPTGPSAPPRPVPAPPAADYVTFACACGQSIKVLRRHSGRTVRCPKCQTGLIVP